MCKHLNHLLFSLCPVLPYRTPQLSVLDRTYYVEAGSARTLKCVVCERLVGWAFIVNMIEEAPSSTRARRLLDSCTPLSRSTAWSWRCGLAETYLSFKCALRVSPQLWPIPGLLMSEPLFMFPYYCQMYAFKPGISARCSSSDNYPVSNLH